MHVLTDLRTFLVASDTSALDPDRAAAIDTVRSMITSSDRQRTPPNSERSSPPAPPAPGPARMYRDFLDEGATLPALTFQLVDSVGDNLLDGQPDGLSRTRVQIDVWTMLDADRTVLAEAVKTALEGLVTAFMGSTEVNALLCDNEIDSFEPERRQYRRTLDFTILYA